jgi:HPt (histidine-containing phosphotransfer) domain-containing protein
MNVLEDAARSLGLDQDEVLDFMKDFVEHTRGDIENLRLGLQGGDAAAVAEKGHSIKGAALNLYLSDIASAAAEIEKRGKQGNLGGVEALVTSLEQNVDELASRLTDQG